MAGVPEQRGLAPGGGVPPRLDGRLVQLRLLRTEDFADLASTCLAPEVWRQTMAKMRTVQDLSAYLEQGRDQYRLGRALPFVIRLVGSRQAIGSTRLAATADPRTLEIGWTFIAPEWHRKGVNAEAKLLLLDHAFRQLGCRRVLFKVAAGNDRSAAALKSFGAAPADRSRESGDGAADHGLKWFELLREQWPASRAILASRVARALATRHATAR